MCYVHILWIFWITNGISFKDVPPKRSQQMEENPTPCEKVFCAYGALCLVDQKTQKAYCRCPDNCADVFAPVCGTDDVTYANECRLRRAACVQQRRITVRLPGPCDSRNPCDNTECHFGAECRPSLDRRSAECFCRDKCGGTAERNNEKSWQMVCGTDGKDYPNECELSRTACREMREVHVKYYGRCDPCDGVECPPMQVCQLDDDRNPSCRCNSACSIDVRPICGSDGRTYASECTLRVEACRFRKNLRVFHQGECTSGSNPCIGFPCQHGQECHVDPDGQPTCICPTACYQVMRPVCGSDGITYDSECHLKRESCLHKRTVVISYRGVCGDEALCRELSCPIGAVCVVKARQPTCACPSCSEEFRPVCGSDGISYPNECRLRREACEKRKIIKVAHDGFCGKCESVKCNFYAICETNGQGEPSCVCPQSCVKVESPVCGSDGVSYQNECELRVAACQKQQLVTVASRGPCDQCKNVQCHQGAQCQHGRCVCRPECPGTYDPVCANNTATYRNECEMQKTACLLGTELVIVSHGECSDVTNADSETGSGGNMPCEEDTCLFGGVCDQDSEGNTRCLCLFDCTSDLKPVCGSDGKVYGNDCHRRAESCNQQRDIAAVPLQRCNVHLPIVSSTTVEPELVHCYGEAPLTDPITGFDMLCGNDAESPRCPTGSYCHVLNNIGKCCRDPPIDCEDTPYGCCPDGEIQAKGPNYMGCEDACQCNRLGSYNEVCDDDTNQCTCKPGVGGVLCDRCLPSFWGLHKIAEGNSGCTPCSCNEYGSVRDDCEQMTGRCVCKQGVQSMKCDLCPSGSILGPDGCTQGEVETKAPSCEDLKCRFGATCKEKEGEVRCVCDFRCPREGNEVPVCGSDGNTYGSECQLRLFSCRYQSTITIRHYGPCQRDVILN